MSQRIEQWQGRYPERGLRTRKQQKNTPKGASSLKAQAQRSTQGTFDDALEDRDRRNLSQILDDVHEAGEELKEDPTLANIREYRGAVQAFMNYVVARMLAVEEKVSGLAVLKRKKFTLIRVIDSKLENLATEVLSTQAVQISILDKVDEINGLLVDLTT